MSWIIDNAEKTARLPSVKTQVPVFEMREELKTLRNKGDTARDATARTLVFSAQSSKILRPRIAGRAMKTPLKTRELAGGYIDIQV